MFVTTKECVYSVFNESYEHITIPENSALIFRSFKEYDAKNLTDPSQLALFYFLKERMTVCLVVSDATPVLYMTHVEWEQRLENSAVTEALQIQQTTDN
jgi:hypothetical protein